jgi:anti-sigma-K factor RskA
MDCAAVAELLPAYALDALPPEEQVAVEEHLASCGLHEEALALERVAARLPEAIEEREPPAALRERILAASRESPSAADAARDGRPPRSIERAGAPVAAPPRPTPWRPARLVPYAIAAALAVLVIGFVSLNVLGSGGTTVREATSPDGVSARLAYNAGDRSAELSFEGLPAVDATHTYQLWTVAPGGIPVSAGLLDRAADGTASQSLSGSFEDGTTFAITVEPAGGSEQPTTEPLIATVL